jgi:hypothetical protein
MLPEKMSEKKATIDISIMTIFSIVIVALFIVTLLGKGTNITQPQGTATGKSMEGLLAKLEFLDKDGERIDHSLYVAKGRWLVGFGTGVELVTFEDNGKVHEFKRPLKRDTSNGCDSGASVCLCICASEDCTSAEMCRTLDKVSALSYDAGQEGKLVVKGGNDGDGIPLALSIIATGDKTNRALTVHKAS